MDSLYLSICVPDRCKSGSVFCISSSLLLSVHTLAQFPSPHCKITCLALRCSAINNRSSMLELQNQKPRTFLPTVNMRKSSAIVGIPSGSWGIRSWNTSSISKILAFYRRYLNYLVIKAHYAQWLSEDRRVPFLKHNYIKN